MNVGSPLFVLRKDPINNALIVGPRTALGRQQLTAHTVNWINGAPPPAPLLAGVKIRYKANAMAAQITPLPDQRALVEFDQPLAGITAGQAAVFFDGDRCLGGGIIADAAPAGDHIALDMVTAV